MAGDHSVPRSEFLGFLSNGRPNRIGRQGRSPIRSLPDVGGHRLRRGQRRSPFCQDARARIGGSLSDAAKALPFDRNMLITTVAIIAAPP
jgi:hypothetical protein